MTSPSFEGSASHWLVRLGSVFDDQAPRLWEALGAVRSQCIAPEFHVLSFASPVSLNAHVGEAHPTAFLRWMLPMHHQWPTPLPRTENFVEKAAQALASKFAGAGAQNAFATAARHDVALRRLASNLRGRLLQVLAPASAQGNMATAKRSPPPFAVDPESQDPLAPSLFLFLYAKGLLAGVVSPFAAKSLYPGGTRYVSQQGNDVVSRAGAKLVEGASSLKLCRLADSAFAPSAKWLELGASPGGMTQELLSRGLHVTALDRASLDPRLLSNSSLVFHRYDVGSFHPARETRYDALLCDMNGDWTQAFAQVNRLATSLLPHAPVLFTLKFGAENQVDDVVAALRQLVQKTSAEDSVLSLRFVTHSTYNRLELTTVLERI